MTTLGSHARLRLAHTFISDATWFTRLRVDQLNIGYINESFFINDAAAAIGLRVRLLMTLNHSCAFYFDLASRWCYLEHTTTLSFIAPSNNCNLIVLSDFRALCAWHTLKLPPARVKQSS